MSEHAYQICINPLCRSTFDIREVLTSCVDCGDLLDIDYDWNKFSVPQSFLDLEKRGGNRRDPIDFSGVWRFRDLLPFADEKDIVTIGEGQTILQKNSFVGKFVGMNTDCLFLQYEGLNPSGSFKDNGMTAAAWFNRRRGRSIEWRARKYETTTI